MKCNVLLENGLKAPEQGTLYLTGIGTDLRGINDGAGRDESGNGTGNASFVPSPQIS